jgi:hypothetical protein
MRSCQEGWNCKVTSKGKTEPIPRTHILVVTDGESVNGAYNDGNGDNVFYKVTFTEKCPY